MPGTIPRDRKRKANQAIAFEAADHLPANFLCDHKHADRNEVGVGELPNLFLQINAGLQFVEALALANDDVFCGVARRVGRFGYR